MFGGQREWNIRLIFGPVSHKSVFSLIFLALAVEYEDREDYDDEQKQQHPDDFWWDLTGFTWNTDKL